MMLRTLASLGLVLLLFVPARAEDADGARISLLSGEVLRDVRLTKITADQVTFTDSSGKGRMAKLDDLVSYTRRGSVVPLPAPAVHHVVVLLRGGDRIAGSLLPGKDEYVEITSPLAGPQSFHVDDLEEIRFEKAWRETREKPVYEAGEQDFDLFTYTHLDRLEGTFLRVSARDIVAHTRWSDEQAIDFGKLLAIRFADAPAPKVPEGRLAEVRLVDGSRITAKAIRSDGKRMTATTLRDEEFEVALTDLLSVHQKGGRFVYLSDLTAKETEIVPWIGEAYAWDRPRIDLSFLDRPIQVGGETYQKGIGVISGTSLTYTLDGTYRLFTARIAVDDAAGDEGDVVFEVLVDGKSKYKSDVARRLETGGTPARIPAIDLSGAKELTLRVLYVDDFVMDFANWIEPMLVK